MDIPILDHQSAVSATTTGDFKRDLLLSQWFGIICFSVHDLDSSACDTESEDRRENPRLNLNKVKIVRSKSSSPNRQVRKEKNVCLRNSLTLTTELIQLTHLQSL